MDKIRKATDLTPVVATLAAGWLARENKVELSEDDRNPVVSLNGK